MPNSNTDRFTWGAGDIELEIQEGSPKTATSKWSMNFPTQEALKKYLDAHPRANKSLHKVVETKAKKTKKVEKPTLNSPEETYNRLFSHHNPDQSKWSSSLTIGEKQSLSQYTGSSYTAMNNILRKTGNYYDQDYYAESIHNIKSALSKYKLPQSIYVYRGMNFKAIPQDTLDDIVYGNIDPKNVKWTDKGFVSTSVSPKQAFTHKKVQCKITLPKGTPGAYIAHLSQHSSEQEFLIPPDHTFQITKATKSGDKYKLDVTLIPKNAVLEPEISQPSAPSPVVEKPVVEKPVVEKPVVEKPVVKTTPEPTDFSATKYKKTKTLLDELGHKLHVADVESIEEWVKAKPPRGKKIDDAEKLRRFLLKASPETRERMKGVTPAEFGQIIAAIMSDEEVDVTSNPKTARFQKGVPADPTVNMSKEDAEKWWDMNEEHKDNFKTASLVYGLYEYPEKVASLGLRACADLRHEAGKIATTLHRKRMADYEKVTSFLKEHSKQAKCAYSRLLSDCYPDAGLEGKRASALPYPVGQMHFSFVGNRKPFNVDVISEINNIEVEGRDYSGKKEKGLLLRTHQPVNHSPNLNYEQEKEGFQKETVFTVDVPKGGEHEAKKAIMDLGKRLGFKVTSLIHPHKPQIIKP